MSLPVSQPSAARRVLIIRPEAGAGRKSRNQENVSVPRRLKSTLFQILMRGSLFTSREAGSIINQESLSCAAAFLGSTDRQ